MYSRVESRIRTTVRMKERLSTEKGERGEVEWAVRLKRSEGPESGGLDMGAGYQRMCPHRGSLLF